MKAIIAILFLVSSLAMAHAIGIGGEGLRFGRLGAMGKNGAGGGGGGGTTGFILMVDGTSRVLQTDGASKVCRAGGC